MATIWSLQALIPSLFSPPTCGLKGRGQPAGTPATSFGRSGARLRALRVGIASHDPYSERLSTMPGHVAPDASSWVARPLPNRSRLDAHTSVASSRSRKAVRVSRCQVVRTQGDGSGSAVRPARLSAFGAGVSRWTHPAGDASPGVIGSAETSERRSACRIGGGQYRVTGTNRIYVRAGQKGMGTMPMVESVAMRHRKYVKNVVIPTFQRVSEDRVINGAEIAELEEVLIGDSRFVEAQAMISAVNVANSRSTDSRHFGDLISMRDATLALLPDAAA